MLSGIINKQYHTLLTTDDIQNIVRHYLSETDNLGINKYTGSLDPNSFILRSSNTNILGIIEENGKERIIHTTYKSRNKPVILFLGVALFLLAIFFIPNFTLNGRESNALIRILFVTGGIGIAFWIIIVLSYQSVDLERLKFEKQLKISPSLR